MPPPAEIDLQICYLGQGPVVWSGSAADFGLQDREGGLHAGTPHPGGRLFELRLEVRRGSDGRPVLSGAFAHGPPSGRFLYLSWRNADGAYARRLKLSLPEIDGAWLGDAGVRSIVGAVDDCAPRATKTGVNIGGAHPVTWRTS